MMTGVLMHQGLGLDAFNELPNRKALHALYECCNSVTMAGDLVKGRCYADRDALYRKADTLLFSLSEESVDDILQAYPEVGTRHNDVETERKVLRNEIAKLNRSRLERMLGPEGGYDNWA